MKSTTKRKSRAKLILKQLDENPGLFRVLSLPKKDFIEVRDFLCEHESRTVFKYRDTLIKQL